MTGMQRARLEGALLGTMLAGAIIFLVLAVRP